MALLETVDQISKSVDKKDLTIGICVDLSEAFDTVNHKILLDKLECYGIRTVDMVSSMVPQTIVEAWVVQWLGH